LLAAATTFFSPAAGKRHVQRISTIGATQQYRGFTTFNKIDTSTWD
jgi:hypothetical protein